MVCFWYTPIRWLFEQLVLLLPKVVFIVLIDQIGLKIEFGHIQDLKLGVSMDTVFCCQVTDELKL